jgi:hypothetical protein
MGFLLLKEDGTLGPLPAPIRTTEDVKRQANDGMLAIMNALSQMEAAATIQDMEASRDTLRDLVAWTAPRYYDLNVKRAKSV